MSALIVFYNTNQINMKIRVFWLLPKAVCLKLLYVLMELYKLVCVLIS